MGRHLTLGEVRELLGLPNLNEKYQRYLENPEKYPDPYKGWAVSDESTETKIVLFDPEKKEKYYFDIGVF